MNKNIFEMVEKFLSKFEELNETMKSIQKELATTNSNLTNIYNELDLINGNGISVSIERSDTI